MNHLSATGTMYDKTITLTRISKQKAKKAYDQGKEIFLQSSNLYPFGVWQTAFPVNNGQGYESFEQLINNYSYYNCDSERGKYIHFYEQKS